MSDSHYDRAIVGAGRQLYINHVTQAHEGCDFDLLQHGPPTPEPPIF